MTKHNIQQDSNDGSFIFFWRVEEFQEDDGFFDLSDLSLAESKVVCPFCKSQTIHNSSLNLSIFPWRAYCKCLLCGWSAISSYRYAHEINVPVEDKRCTITKVIYGDAEHLRSILREFELSSEEVALDELGTYIRLHQQVLDNLSWRRFEQLVADIFRNYKYNVILTASSRDQGADLILLNKEGTQCDAIVECKRFRSNRKVQVDLVRKLLGAAIDWDTKRAYLVTSSNFTKGSRDYATRVRSKGFELDLFALSDLLSMLQIYNAKLPRIYLLSDQDRLDLVQNNYIKLSNDRRLTSGSS